MAKKARLTVFSRFLIMMLFVAPLAYLTASYYNGEDGIQNIKNIINLQNKTTDTESAQSVESNSSSTDVAYQIRKLEEELTYKQKRLDELYQENEQLQQKLKACEN